MGLESFATRSRTAPEKGDWLTALNGTRIFRQSVGGPGACPLFVQSMDGCLSPFPRVSLFLRFSPIERRSGSDPAIRNGQHSSQGEFKSGKQGRSIDLMLRDDDLTGPSGRSR